MTQDDDAGSAAGYEGPGGYGHAASYRSLPDAASQLTGPGSSAYIGRPYSSSYAYETEAGGIYTHTTAHSSAGYIDETSYTVSTSGYKLTEREVFEDFQDRSGPRYGYGSGIGYHSSYASPIAYTENTFRQTQNTVGETTSYEISDSDSTATTTGYIYASYAHQTTQAIDGQRVTGAGYAYVVTSVTDPYGYSTYDPKTSTF